MLRGEAIRIAFGGLSIPYRYRSRTDIGDNLRPYERLRRLLVELFPVLDGVTVTHRWGGVLAAPRDSFPSVGIHNWHNWEAEVYRMIPDLSANIG